MKLSNAEKETIILFDEEGQTASVRTYNRRLLNTLRKLASSHNDCSCDVDNDQFGEYVVPKSWIKVSAPRQLSEEQRAKMAERARANLKRGELYKQS